MSKIFPFTGGGGSPQQNFFSGLNMYQAKSGVKNFSLYWGWGWGRAAALNKNFFQSEHVSSQIWCQKFFPLLGGGSPQQNFFSGLNMYQAKSGVKNFSLYWGWGWGRAAALNKNFFQSEHVSSQIWCQNFFPLLEGGWGRAAALNKNFFPV